MVRGLILTIAAWVAAGTDSAQTAPRISGTVKNLAGKGLTGAQVTLAAEGSLTPVAVGAAGADGSYGFTGLRPAKYSVWAELPGFLPSSRVTVDLTGATHRVAHLVLVPDTVAAAGPRSGPVLTAAGFRGLIDAGGYSAPASAARTAGLMEAMAGLNAGSAKVGGSFEPCGPDSLFGRGYRLILAQSLDRAAAMFQAAVKLHPASLKLWLGWGVASFLAGEEADAVDRFLRAADLAPSDPLPYRFLAKASTPAGPRAAEVRGKLKRLVELEPGSPDARYEYALYLMSSEATSEEQSRAAEALLRSAIALDPAFAKAHYELAVLLDGRSQDSAAIAAYREALRLDPSVPEAHYRLAQAYRRTGQHELSREALEGFKQARNRRKAEAEDLRAGIQNLLSAVGREVEDTQRTPSPCPGIPH